MQRWNLHKLDTASLPRPVDRRRDRDCQATCHLPAETVAKPDTLFKRTTFPLEAHTDRHMSIPTMLDRDHATRLFLDTEWADDDGMALAGC